VVGVLCDGVYFEWGKGGFICVEKGVSKSEQSVDEFNEKRCMSGSVESG